MKHTYKKIIWARNAQGTRFGVSSFLFFCLLFVVFFSSWNVVGQEVTITSTASPGPTADSPIPLTIKFKDAVDLLMPADFTVTNGQPLQNLLRTDVNFEFQGEIQIEKFTVKAGFSELLQNLNRIDAFIKEKLEKSVISIDFNDKNELFYLTLDDGVYKIDANGDAQKVISETQFDTPADLVININNGIIYIADSEKGKVLIFDSAFVKIGEIGTGSNADSNNPRGATGLALDAAGNIYVADNFTGNTPNQDAIKIYTPNGTLINKTGLYGTSNIKDPFRIAVDKYNNIYLSESGGTNGRILIFDNNLNPLKIIEGGEQGTPGSLIVDDFGYLYAIDYKSDFNLSDLFNSPQEVLNNYKTIRDTKYTINVFDTNRDFIFVKKFDNTNFNLPLDIAINSCGLIHINNLKLSGPGPSGNFGGYPTNIDATFDFSIRKFKRQDTFAAEVVPDNPGLVTVALKGNDLFKCDPQPTATFSIEYRPEDNNVPEAKCKPVTISLDVNGNASLNAIEVYDGDADADNVSLSLSKNSFTCADLGNGNQVTLTVTDKNDASRSDSCTAIITVVDDLNPVAKCIAPGKEFVLNNGSVTISASDIDDGSSDNCEIVNREVSPNTFTSVGTKTVTLTITDGFGKIDECTTTIEVVDNTPPLEAKCKPVTISLDVNGNASLNAIQVYDGDAEADNVSLSLSKTSFTCADLGNGNQITLTVTDKNDASRFDTCTAIITVVDDLNPVAKCIAPGKEFVLNNGSVTISASDIDDGSSDNCEIVNREVSPNTFTTVGTKTITLTITDSSDNTEECTTTIEVLENMPPLEAKCKSTTIFLDANGNATLTAAQVYDGDADIDNVTLKIDKTSFDCSDLRENTVTLTVTGENGASSTCPAIVTVMDKIAPIVSCPQEILVEYTTEKTYTVPDFSTLYSSSDNCSSNLKYFQSPEIGAVITEDKPANFKVGDESNNFTTCNFNIKFFKNTELQILNCPSTQTFEVDENCSYLIPDIVSTINTNIEGAVVTQNIAPGFRVNGANTLIITAKFENQTDTCEVLLIAKDSIEPEIVCPGDQNENFNPENGFALPNYGIQAQASDNCAVAKIEQIPDVGTVISEDTEVTIRVEDSVGNFATCTFMVLLTENASSNTAPVAIDDGTYNTDVNVTLPIPASGVLSNDTDVDGDALTAVIRSQPLNGSVTLNQDGSFNYTPASNYSGLDSFTYVANDGTTDSNIATVRIEVIRVSDNTVVCKETLSLELDVNGSASLNAEDLFTTRPADLQFSVSKDTFNCADLGENIITLSYSNTEIQGSCEIKVSVIDNIAPIINIQPLTISLNNFGSISITPEMLDNGTTDNCTELTYSISKSTFGCKDIGENMLTFTATDNSGNVSSANINVTITGNCEINPLPGVEYIFIYPNPTSGPFQFSTPTGVTIERVEAYDFRGRIIMFKEFSAVDLQYAMDLSGVQNAVYILKLFTSEGISIIRVIIN